jgi:NifU-like protein involved in Fe-S cluster formation
MSEVCSGEDVEEALELLMDEVIDKELTSPQDVKTIKAIVVKR